jgi:hypothetical protein
MTETSKKLQQIIKETVLTEAKKKSYKFHMVKKPNFLYKEKQISIDSVKHISLLKKTVDHLEGLKTAYATGSAMRHIVSQTCSRLKRLIKRLERQL